MTEESRFIDELTAKVHELHRGEEDKYNKGRKTRAKIQNPNRQEVLAWTNRNIDKKNHPKWFQVMNITELALNILHGMEITHDEHGNQKIWINRPPEEQVNCRICGLTNDNLKVCGQCNVAVYCSKKCQTQDWQAHSKECLSNL
jgi:hypothetical protein